MTDQLVEQVAPNIVPNTTVTQTHAVIAVHEHVMDIPVYMTHGRLNGEAHVKRRSRA